MESRAVLREVQSRFSGANPELANGFAEHCPMGAEALLALGLPADAVLAWAAQHLPTPLEPEAPVALRRRALQAELATQPWDDVLRREVAALAPHVGAHLFHGLIRTAHAVRALRSSVDEAGLDELAAGLAAWQVWSASRGTPSGRGTGARRAGLDAIVDAARRGAGACAAAPSIPNIHAVTAPMAFLLMADLLDETTITRAAAAFDTTHDHHPEPAPSNSTTPPPAEALGALLRHRDAHPAKLTEAALRGFTLTADGVFLDAAAAIMGPWPTMTPPGSIPPSSPHGSA